MVRFAQALLFVAGIVSGGGGAYFTVTLWPQKIFDTELMQEFGAVSTSETSIYFEYFTTYLNAGALYWGFIGVATTIVMWSAAVALGLLAEIRDNSAAKPTPKPAPSQED